MSHYSPLQQVIQKRNILVLGECGMVIATDVVTGIIGVEATHSTKIQQQTFGSYVCQSVQFESMNESFMYRALTIDIATMQGIEQNGAADRLLRMGLEDILKKFLVLDGLNIIIFVISASLQNTSAPNIIQLCTGSLSEKAVGISALMSVDSHGIPQHTSELTETYKTTLRGTKLGIICTQFDLKDTVSRCSTILLSSEIFKSTYETNSRDALASNAMPLIKALQQVIQKRNILVIGVSGMAIATVVVTRIIGVEATRSTKIQQQTFGSYVCQSAQFESMNESFMYKALTIDIATMQGIEQNGAADRLLRMGLEDILKKFLVRDGLNTIIFVTSASRQNTSAPNIIQLCTGSLSEKAVGISALMSVDSHGIPQHTSELTETYETIPRGTKLGIICTQFDLQDTVSRCSTILLSSEIFKSTYETNSRDALASNAMPLIKALQQVIQKRNILVIGVCGMAIATVVVTGIIGVEATHSTKIQQQTFGSYVCQSAQFESMKESFMYRALTIDIATMQGIEQNGAADRLLRMGLEDILKKFLVRDGLNIIIFVTSTSRQNTSAPNIIQLCTGSLSEKAVGISALMSVDSHGIPQHTSELTETYETIPRGTKLGIICTQFDLKDTVSRCSTILLSSEIFKSTYETNSRDALASNAMPLIKALQQVIQKRNILVIGVCGMAIATVVVTGIIGVEATHSTKIQQQTFGSYVCQSAQFESMNESFMYKALTIDIAPGTEQNGAADNVRFLKKLYAVVTMQGTEKGADISLKVGLEGILKNFLVLDGLNIIIFVTSASRKDTSAPNIIGRLCTESLSEKAVGISALMIVDSHGIPQHTSELTQTYETILRATKLGIICTQFDLQEMVSRCSTILLLSEIFRSLELAEKKIRLH